MLLDELSAYELILASASPRRSELMRQAGFTFSIFSGIDADESFPADMPGKEIPLYIAEKKSKAFPMELKLNQLLITADTIVFQDGKVLLKPENESDAFSILKKISGHTHKVFTGVYLRSQQKEKGFSVETEVIFSSLSDEEISYYIHNYKPFDKAGAYGIQEWIGIVGVDEIKGSYFNVMGLPIHRLYRELEAFI